MSLANYKIDKFKYVLGAKILANADKCLYALV